MKGNAVDLKTRADWTSIADPFMHGFLHAIDPGSSSLSRPRVDYFLTGRSTPS